MNEEWTEFSSDVVVAIDTRLTHGHCRIDANTRTSHMAVV